MAVPRQPIFNVPQSVAWLLGATFVLHVVRISLPPDVDDYVIGHFGFVAANVVSWWTGVGYSAQLGQSAPSMIEVALPFFTHIFIHGDFVHLGFNLLWLLPFGAAVARRFGDRDSGKVRFLLFYLLTGACGALAFLIADPGSTLPLVGASGAVSGLMGGATRFMFSPSGFYGAWHRPLTPLNDSRLLTFAGVFTLINVLFGTINLGLTGGDATIAWQAHIGGFFAGLLLFGLFDRPLVPGRRSA